MVLQLNRYRVVRELGRGGMGVVYQAIDEELDRGVALKVLHATLAAHPTAVERFVREARVAARIRHPHVIDVFDVGVADGVPFIVMELLEGETLAAFFAREGRLSSTRIADLFLPILSAVAAAHENGLVHRDLKPGNVLLAKRTRYREDPIVLDFGISKQLDQEPEGAITLSGSILGTLHYMAPEQMGGARFASPRSDQYALGAMLYECGTGRRPFEGDSTYELMHAVMTAPLKPMREIHPAVPTALDEIVRKAMDRDPAARFPSVHALGSALLSLGGKKAWAIWCDEFVDRPDSDDATRTAGDQDPLPVLARAASPGSPKTRRWSTATATLPALALLVAAVLGALATRRRVEPESVPPAVESNMMADAGPPATNARAPTPDETSPTAVPIPAAAPSDIPPAPRRVTVAPRRAAPSPAVLAPSVAPSSTAPPPSPSEGERPRVEFGRNKSAIVE